MNSISKYTQRFISTEENNEDENVGFVLFIICVYIYLFFLPFFLFLFRVANQ
jgi:hypothetical protein